jgi:hypothetical protein
MRRVTRLGIRGNKRERALSTWKAVSAWLRIRFSSEGFTILRRLYLHHYDDPLLFRPAARRTMKSMRIENPAYLERHILDILPR